MQAHRRYTWRILLLPFSLVYGLIIRLRNLLFDAGILPSAEFDLPVISVGNISVGGTGKTPHVEYLVDLLKDDYAVATLSRGYKRKTRDFILAANHSTVEDIGDEPRQIKQKYPDVMVAVDRRRVHGVQQLLKEQIPPDVILLDDAYQHRYIKPGFSILLIDYNHPVNKDMLLPAGRLREPAGSRKRADIILVTRSPERMKPIERRQYVNNFGLELGQHLFFTSMVYDKIYPVFDIPDPSDLAHLKKNKPAILIVTGIADPRGIRKFARSISTNIRAIAYPDHHAFSIKDIEQIDKAFRDLGSENVLILTTEKDAMRFHAVMVPDHLKKVLYQVRIKVRFLNDDTENFNKQIIRYVTSNKRNSILHKK